LKFPFVVEQVTVASSDDSDMSERLMCVNVWLLSERVVRATLGDDAVMGASLCLDSGGGSVGMGRRLAIVGIASSSASSVGRTYMYRTNKGPK
jgi:hypothetical protein